VRRLSSTAAPPTHLDDIDPDDDDGDGDGDGERSRRDARTMSSPPMYQRQVVHLDFFGEPVTFATAAADPGSNKSSTATTATNKAMTSRAMAAYDGHLLTVVTRGLSAIGGGEEEGLEVQAAHASALSWSEALRFAAAWNATAVEEEDDGDDEEERSTDRAVQSCPMLAVVTVAPLLAQAGVAYASHLDQLLQHTRPAAPGLPSLSFVRIARSAVERLHHRHDHPSDRSSGLSDREGLHLRALECLLDQNPKGALRLLLKLLRKCPGDVLALSLAVDVSHRLGDAGAALRAAGGVAAYWEERRGGFIAPSLPGHAISTSYQAVGFAASSGGSAVSLAELLADRVLSSRRHWRITGGVATWAHALVCDATGRVAEGISAAANSDGIRNYEGCGFLFFNAHLAGYGARFALDREERGRGKSKALRLYDEQFRQVLELSGYASGRPWQRPNQPAPISWAQSTVQLESGGAGAASESDRGSFFSRLFGRDDDTKNQSGPGQTENPDDSPQYEIISQGNHSPSSRLERWDPLAEDVLTWLPPTPNLLADATLLLLRFTLNGTIARSDLRWEEVRKGWEATLSMQDKHGGRLTDLSPLASVVASIVVPPSETGADQMGSGRLALGLHMLGEQLQLGTKPAAGGDEVEDLEKAPTLFERVIIADREPEFWLPASREGGDDNGTSEKWKTIVEHLATAIDAEEEGDSLSAWTFDSRPILEHAIVYACCKSGDLECLCLARSICGQGVTLRPNSPEEWWRYSIVLGLLGDDVASEDALLSSMRVGGGQGARKV
jgi:hypothetical protein